MVSETDDDEKKVIEEIGDADRSGTRPESKTIEEKVKMA